MTFARKMLEFYMIIARNIFFPNWVASASVLCTEFATSLRRLPTGAFMHTADTTLLLCLQICSHSSRLSPTICEFRTHRRCDSTRQVSRVGVSGLYWALAI